MTREFSIAVIAGDGIGPEVVPEGLKVLSAAAESVGGAKFDFTHYDLGGKHWRETGEALSDETLEELRGYDSIFFGAVGDPEVPSGILERGLLLKMRFAFEHYVNLRPTKLLPGVSSPLANPGDIDFVVVREGTEGPYAGQGGYLRYGTEHEVATEVSVNTAFGVERVVRDAFARARARRGKLTYVHKHNVMQYAGHLWRRIVERVAEEFPDVEFDYVHTDACTIYLVTDPARFDVIVTDNLFGDIITDLAAAVTGGIGLAASGNINPDRTAPSLFEPIHGSAPDIAGQGKADPTASVLSASLMAAHLGLDDIAARIQSAAESDLATRGTSLRTTSQIGDALAAAASGPVA